MIRLAITPAACEAIAQPRATEIINMWRPE